MAIGLLQKLGRTAEAIQFEAQSEAIRAKQPLPNFVVALMRRASPTDGNVMCEFVFAIAKLRESAFGYEPTWAGQVETQPSPLQLHALITPP